MLKKDLIKRNKFLESEAKFLTLDIEVLDARVRELKEKNAFLQVIVGALGILTALLVAAI